MSLQKLQLVLNFVLFLPGVIVVFVVAVVEVVVVAVLEGIVVGVTVFVFDIVVVVIFGVLLVIIVALVSVSPRVRLKNKIIPVTRETKMYFLYFRNH